MSAFVTWRPGYDGGSPQRFEVWHRASSQKEYQWKHSKPLSADVTSYRIKDLLDGEVYLFSVRGINKEGSGPFSLRKKAGPGIPPDSPLLPDFSGMLKDLFNDLRPHDSFRFAFISVKNPRKGLMCILLGKKYFVSI